MKDGEEKKAIHILTDPKLSAIKAMLEKDHAIDCILLLTSIVENGKKRKTSCAKTA